MERSVLKCVKLQKCLQKNIAQEKILEIVRNMLLNRFSVQTISENTGISIEQISEIADEIERR